MLRKAETYKARSKRVTRLHPFSTKCQGKKLSPMKGLARSNEYRCSRCGVIEK